MNARQSDLAESLETLFASSPFAGFLVDRAPLGVFVVDADFRIAHLNPVAVSVFGEIPGGILGRDFDEIMHIMWEERYADEIHEICRRTLETGESTYAAERAELRVDRGVVEYYEWQLDRLLLPDGRFGLVCFFRDIGESVRAGELLRVQEEASRRRAEALARLYALSERGSRPEVSLEECLTGVLETALWVTRTETGNVQLFDEETGALRIAVHRGLPPDFLELFREVRADHRSASGAAMNALDRVTVEDVETSPVFHGSPARAVLLRCGIRAVQSTPLKNGAGRILGMVTTHFKEPHRPTEPDLGLLDLVAREGADFIERKRAEQAARAITQQLHVVTDTMAALVARCSRDRRYVWVSKPYAAWLGKSVEDVEGRPIVDLLGRESCAQLEPYFERVLRGETVRYEERIDVPGVGPRWILATYTPTYGLDGACDGWVAVITDIDERRRIEETFRRASAEAEEANRAKDAFLATISHELRSPLQGVLAWVTLLRSGQLDPAQTVRALESVERSVRLQAQLVNDLVDVSRIAAGKVVLEQKPLDVAAVVRSTVEECLPAAISKGVAVEVIAEDCGLVLGDRERLHQVFSNLLGNALKFTDKGGRITLTCRRENGHVSVEVADTGIGIAPEFLPRLFERFSQADSSSTRRYGGLGLGLSIVKHLVELHDGTVRVASEGRGLGASFEVRLPEALSDPRVARTNSAAEPGSQLQLSGVHVLLVEDDEDMLQAMAFALRRMGAVVLTAGSAREAWSLLELRAPDVVVSDIGMPGEDGYSLVRRIRESDNRRDVPAIALTGFATPEDEELTRSAGFSAHLAKPVEIPMLVAVIRSVLAERTALAGPQAVSA